MVWGSAERRFPFLDEFSCAGGEAGIGLLAFQEVQKTENQTTWNDGPRGTVFWRGDRYRRNDSLCPKNRISVNGTKIRNRSDRHRNRRTLARRPPARERATRKRFLQDESVPRRQVFPPRQAGHERVMAGGEPKFWPASGHNVAVHGPFTKLDNTEASKPVGTPARARRGTRCRIFTVTRLE